MLKILQVGLQQCVNWELLDVQAGFRKGIKLPKSTGSSKKQESSEKHLLLLYWLRQSLWMCGLRQTGKFLNRWEYHTTFPASYEICMQVKKQQLEPDMEQWTGSK